MSARMRTAGCETRSWFDCPVYGTGKHKMFLTDRIVVVFKDVGISRHVRLFGYNEHIKMFVRLDERIRELQYPGKR
jgi:hypothetical protein